MNRLLPRIGIARSCIAHYREIISVKRSGQKDISVIHIHAHSAKSQPYRDKPRLISIGLDFDVHLQSSWSRLHAS